MTNQPTGSYGGPPPSGPPPYAPSSAPPRRRKGPLFWIGLVMVAGGLGIGVLFLLFVAVSVFGSGVQETVLERGTANKIAVISLEGAIMGSGGSGGQVSQFQADLDAAAAADDVKAIVIQVDSPGGAVTAFDEIHRAILAFKKDTRKPVIVSMGSIAASGGYYASVAGDTIFAQPTTLTGSIGVIIPHYDISAGLDKLGVKYQAITSGRNKDSLAMSKPMKEEQRKILKALVMDMYDTFVEKVERGRSGKLKLQGDAFREQVADGRIFTATEAENQGLIDEIGYLSDATDFAARKAKVGGATVVRYARKPTLFNMLLGKSAGGGSQGAGGVNVRIDFDSLAASRVPRVLYLWTSDF